MPPKMGRGGGQPQPQRPPPSRPQLEHGPTRPPLPASALKPSQAAASKDRGLQATARTQPVLHGDRPQKHRFTFVPDTAAHEHMTGRDTGHFTQTQSRPGPHGTDPRLSPGGGHRLCTQRPPKAPPYPHPPGVPAGLRSQSTLTDRFIRYGHLVSDTGVPTSPSLVI